MTQDTVSFKVSDADKALIGKIAERARKAGMGDVTHHRMNITACHANGNPLRLRELLAADDFNFGHDVYGIDRHIDRDTGRLMNFFRPRFSTPSGGED